MTSKFFNRFPKEQSLDQKLYEGLLNECVHINGCDVDYIFRETRDAENDLLGEDSSSKFEDKYELEMYIETTENFEGDGSIMSKFGMWNRNYTILLLTERQWKQNIPNNKGSRPREGDLIYISTFKKLFEITKVENDEFFYSFGKPLESGVYAWKLFLEQARYSNELLNTGDREIDDIEFRNNAYRNDIQFNYGQGNYIIGEKVVFGPEVYYLVDDQGNLLRNDEGKYIISTVTEENNGNVDIFGNLLVGANTVIANSATVGDWNAQNNILSIININGEFSLDSIVVGIESGAIWTIEPDGVDRLGTKSVHDNRDNITIEEQANTIIVTTETNPFNL